MKRLRPVLPHPSDPTAALVELTGGAWAVIDAADSDAVGAFNWHLESKNFGRSMYAVRNEVVGRENGKRIWKRRSLHGMIAEHTGIDTSQEIDHKDGNGLDCRRTNLRSADHFQNLQNTRRSVRNSSGIKGVCRQGDSWVAEIMVGGRRWRKTFSDLKAASSAVAETRQKLHGEFANHGTKETLQ